jgi:hypothetical protein
VNGTGLALPSLEATHAIAASTIRGGRDLHVSYPGNRHEVMCGTRTPSLNARSANPCLHFHHPFFLLSSFWFGLCLFICLCTFYLSFTLSLYFLFVVAFVFVFCLLSLSLLLLLLLLTFTFIFTFTFTFTLVFGLWSLVFGL